MNRGIRKLVRLQLLTIPVFAVFKFIRPGVLKSNAPEIFKIILLSLPNFFEAVIGTFTLTIIGLMFNERLNKNRRLKPPAIYLIAVLLAGTYVILRELDIIKTRKVTTMDPNDVVFSVIGLVVSYVIIRWMKPKMASK